MSRLDILICKVQSKKLYNTKRFVPKKSLDLNDPYVELKLVKFTQDAQNQVSCCHFYLQARKYIYFVFLKIVPRF